MLSTLSLAMMLAAVPQPAGPHPATPPQGIPTPPPPTEMPAQQTFSDTSKLPLDVLSSLPSPASFDYDGDSKPDAVSVALDKTGHFIVTVTPTSTGKAQQVFQSKDSWTKLGVTNVGLKATGNPTEDATMELWGLKGDKKLGAVVLEVKPAAFSVKADGKVRTFAWSGGAFRAK